MIQSHHHRRRHDDDSGINDKVSYILLFLPSRTIPALRDDETYKKIRLVLKTKYMVTNFSMRASLIIPPLPLHNPHSGLSMFYFNIN